MREKCSIRKLAEKWEGDKYNNGKMENAEVAEIELVTGGRFRVDTCMNMELLICLHFPMAAAWNKQEGYVASSPFKCHFDALIWLHGSLKKS